MPRPILREGVMMEEEVEEEVGRMVPVGMEDQEEVVAQQEAASGPQQNLMVVVVVSKLAGQGMRGIWLVFWGWSGGEGDVSQLGCHRLLRSVSRVQVARTVGCWAELVAIAAPVPVCASLLCHEVVRAGTETEAVGQAEVALVAAPGGLAPVCSRCGARYLAFVFIAPCVVAS
jgi:hypothetical protein